MKKYMSIALLAGALMMSGCGDSDPNVISGIQGQLAAPVCVDDAYTTNQNATLTVNAANGVLANDTTNGGTVTGFDATSAQGGTVAVNADGSFTYTPATSFNGPDFFTYTVANAAGQSTCTVNITVVTINGFFVDAANGNDATGSFQDGNPFATIQAAVTAAGTNQDIIVRPGTYIENVVLLNGQRLLGSGSVLAQGTPVRPIINGGGITLADGNTVDYIRLENSADDAIDGVNQTSGTITDCEIIDTTDVGICLEDSEGDWLISGNTIDGTGPLGIGVIAISDGPNLVTYRVLNNTITNCGFGAVSLFANTGENARSSVEGNTMANTTTPGATLEALSGGTSTMCTRIVNNSNDDAYSIGRAAAATHNVERLSQLTTINSGSATVTVPGGADPATEVADGTCNF